MTFPALALRYEDVAPARGRFVSKFSRADGCWEWTASRNHQGYGRFQLNAASVGAHRVSFVLFVRDLRPGETIDHLCRNRGCVRPSHLEGVSIAENVMRGDGICVRHSRRETCPQGHAYSSRKRSDGRTQRICIECDRAYKREWARRKRRTPVEAYRV